MQKKNKKLSRTIMLLFSIILVAILSPSKVSAIPLFDSEIRYEHYISHQTNKAKKIVSRGTDENAYHDINTYIEEICHAYGMDPNLIKSIVHHESRYNPMAKNGNCVGLMQISTHWHSQRAIKLGVKDFYDPYGNILIGVDYISELFNNYNDPALVLMLYNMKHETAINMYKNGKISKYAKSVLKMANELQKGE